jgi:hypothetical protein
MTPDCRLLALDGWAFEIARALQAHRRVRPHPDVPQPIVHLATIVPAALLVSALLQLDAWALLGALVRTWETVEYPGNALTRALDPARWSPITLRGWTVNEIRVASLAFHMQAVAWALSGESTIRLPQETVSFWLGIEQRAVSRILHRLRAADLLIPVDPRFAAGRSKTWAFNLASPDYAPPRDCPYRFDGWARPEVRA